MRESDAMGELLDTAFTSLPVFMMFGIVLVIVISRIHRPIGSGLGVVFWGLVLVIGHYGYGQGHAVGLPGIPLSRTVFYIMCAVFLALNIATGWAALRARRRGSDIDVEED